MAEPKQMKAAAEKAKKAKAELEELKLKDPAYAAKQKAAEEAFKKELQKDAAEVELSPAMAKAKPPKAALKNTQAKLIGRCVPRNSAQPRKQEEAHTVRGSSDRHPQGKQDAGEERSRH